MASLSSAASSRLAGKTVLVTGASSGIGRACAVAFARAGCARLVLAARRADRLATLQAELAAAFPPVAVLPVELDVRDRRAVLAKLGADLPDGFRDVHVLVNNAGLAEGLESVEAVSEDSFDAMFDTNVKGLLSVTQAVLPGMKARDAGHIINIGSIAGHDVYPGGGVYCASKHAVDALTRTLRLELISTGINVSSVDPGMVETEFSVIRFRGDQSRADKVYE
ncbi:hypothetical protein HK405_000474, partial [Cladochytrium tenue]